MLRSRQMFKIVDKNSIKMKNSTCTFASRRTLESAINMTQANKNDVLWCQMIKSNIKSHHNKSELIHHQNFDDKKIKSFSCLHFTIFKYPKGLLIWLMKFSWDTVHLLWYCMALKIPNLKIGDANNKYFEEMINEG